MRQNNYGYTAGGPVIIPKIYNGRNRTFWFSSFEHTYLNQLGFSGYTTLSPEPYRTGDFSQMLDPTWSGQAQAGSVIGTDALGRPVVFNSIYDPSTTRLGPGGAVVRDVFPGNIIPSARINPVATAILGVGLVAPTSTSMINNIKSLSTGSPFFDEHIIGIKVDQIINDKNRISIYYNQGYRFRNNVSGGTYLPVPGPPTTGWHEQLTPSEMGRVTITLSLIHICDQRGGYGQAEDQAAGTGRG